MNLCPAASDDEEPVTGMGKGVPLFGHRKTEIVRYLSIIIDIVRFRSYLHIYRR
jgi:hypothetical protein